MKNKQFDSKSIFIIIASLFIPLISCLIYCAIDKQSIFNIFFPASNWNDELIYYKQVENVVHYNFPLGFYGYNESRAAIGSFSTWGPVALLPWALLGKLFGWSFSSPIIYNIIFMSLCFAGFMAFTKPSLKQFTALSLLYIAFYPFTRYILSCMPEVYSFGGAILVLGICIYLLNNFKWWLTFLCTLLILLLTLSRPYLLLLLLFICIPLWKHSKKAIIPFAILIPVYAFLFLVYSKLFCAKYLNESMDLSWLTVFKYNSIPASVKYIILLFINRFCNIIKEAAIGIITSAPVGGFCACFLLVFAISIILIFFSKKKESKYFLFTCAISNLGILTSVIMFYSNIQQAAKHFIPFIAITIFLIVLCYPQSTLLSLPLSVCFMLIFLLHSIPSEAFNINLPYKDSELTHKISTGSEAFSSLSLNERDKPYSNTLLVLLDDYVDSTLILSEITPLYSLPAHMAINICTPDYIISNFDMLKEPYIYTIGGGDISKLCQKKSCPCIYKSAQFEIYSIAH